MKTKILLLLTLLFSIASLHAKTLLIVGDSLSAGYGIDASKSWVALLERRIQPLGYKIVNVSTSGDTTRNGRAKLNKALKETRPIVVIIELGANDGLRGLTLSQMKSNLTAMIKQVKKTQATILLLATRLPPNYGKRYITKFRQIYRDLSQQYDVDLVPMFLDKVAGNGKYLQKDGLHPNEIAQPQLFENVWPKLKPLLD